MSDIINKILFSPFFGIVLSLIAYEIGKYFFSKTKSIFCNPLLIGIILTIVFLMVLDIPFEAYDKGGSIIKTGDWLIYFIVGLGLILMAVGYRVYRKAYK